MFASTSLPPSFSFLSNPSLIDLRKQPFKPIYPNYHPRHVLMKILVEISSARKKRKTKKKLLAALEWNKNWTPMAWLWVVFCSEANFIKISSSQWQNRFAITEIFPNSLQTSERFLFDGHLPICSQNVQFKCLFHWWFISCSFFLSL